MSLKKLFERAFVSASSERDADVDAPLAAAVLLVEIAQADQDLADSERRMLAQGVQTVFALQPSAALELIARAEQEQARCISMQPYVSAVNQHCSREQKLHLLEALWAVAWADGRLDAQEEHMMRRIADLLFLSHAEFIQAKLKITGE